MIFILHHYLFMQTKQELLDSLSICIKRGPYIDYKKFPETVEVVLTVLRNYEKGDIAKIVKKTGFKERTMYDWLSRIKANSDYNPLDKQVRENSRIFIEEQEDVIALSILQEELVKGNCFCDMDAIEYLTEAYLDIHSEDENIDTTFNISKGYIYYFKIRHSFVSKLCHIKRRPSTKEIFIDNFIEDIRQLLEHADHSRIINIDETAIFLGPKNIKIWHSKGQDDVSVPVGFNEKNRITALCAISADGGKHNIQFIAKGNTSQVINTQLGDVYPHLATFSENGWSTNLTIYEYLNYIKSLFEDDDEIHIILDIYSAHRSLETKEAAEALGIKLHFIPAGYTDMYQPLDVKIFAIIKAYIKHILRTYLREGKQMTKKDACRMMIAAWEKLEPTRVQEAFEEIISKEKWKGVNLHDLPIMHTCKYFRSRPEEQKRMVLNELIDQSNRDKNGISLISYALDSFGNSNTKSRDFIIKYIHNTAEFDDNVNYYSANGKILSTISLLLVYKILTKNDDDDDMLIKTI